MVATITGIHRPNSQRIRLIRKPGECLDGVDVSSAQVGDIIEVTPAEAALLVAEQWAVLIDDRSAASENAQSPIRRDSTSAGRRDVAADQRKVPRPTKRLRELRAAMESRRQIEQDLRRAEDHFREELRDSRAKTIQASGDPDTNG
jgi:hypothetical protein